MCKAKARVGGVPSPPAVPPGPAGTPHHSADARGSHPTPGYDPTYWRNINGEWIAGDAIAREEAVDGRWREHNVIADAVLAGTGFVDYEAFRREQEEIMRRIHDQLGNNHPHNRRGRGGARTLGRSHLRSISDSVMSRISLTSRTSVGSSTAANRGGARTERDRLGSRASATSSISPHLSGVQQQDRQHQFASGSTQRHFNDRSPSDARHHSNGSVRQLLLRNGFGANVSSTSDDWPQRGIPHSLPTFNTTSTSSVRGHTPQQSASSGLRTRTRWWPWVPGGQQRFATNSGSDLGRRSDVGTGSRSDAWNGYAARIFASNESAPPSYNSTHDARNRARNDSPNVPRNDLEASDLFLPADGF